MTRDEAIRALWVPEPAADWALNKADASNWIDRLIALGVLKVEDTKAEIDLLAGRDLRAPGEPHWVIGVDGKGYLAGGVGAFIWASGFDDRFILRFEESKGAQEFAWKHIPWEPSAKPMPVSQPTDPVHEPFPVDGWGGAVKAECWYKGHEPRLRAIRTLTGLPIHADGLYKISIADEVAAWLVHRIEAAGLKIVEKD